MELMTMEENLHHPATYIEMALLSEMNKHGTKLVIHLSSSSSNK